MHACSSYVWRLSTLARSSRSPTPSRSMTAPRSAPARRLRLLPFLALLVCALAVPARAQSFEEAVIDVGNVGLTFTNAGFIGNPSIRGAPTGPPSFEYPLESGVEHLFEAGLWVGARRADGVVSVRTGAVTTSAGYQPGASGYEFAQASFITQRSSLPDSPFYTPSAISQQDVLATFNDTTRFVPGTLNPMPDPQGRLGLEVRSRAYAWSFPFTEYFVILEYEIENISEERLEDVWVGLWHDLVVRNVNTTTDAGTSFFNKNGLGFMGYPVYEAGTGEVLDPAPDSMFVTYAFNAGGQEETLNTYGSFAFLGADWEEAPGQARHFHPFLAEDYEADGYEAPRVNPRWWQFSGNDPEIGRPQSDAERYRRMHTPYPNPQNYQEQAAYEDARDAFFERIRTEGRTAQGNWIGLTPVGPFPFLEPGATVTVTFAAVAAMKPEEFQGQAGKPVDTEESREILRTNVFWAQQTYEGDGTTRYRIPEPPQAPRLRVEIESGAVTLYWDREAEESIDPVTGRKDFEGYRIYRSDPGDDLAGDIFGRAGLIAQYDRPGNHIGLNNGFEALRIPEDESTGFDEDQGLYYREFPDDPTRYYYRFRESGLLNGWQYAFAVTAFDEGDPEVGLPSFESSRSFNAVRVFPGTPAAAADDGQKVGVYPNPYSVRAAWDGATSRTRKLYFNNLPARARIRIYTVSGDIVKEIQHEAGSSQGDIRWFNDFSGEGRQMAGGEHAWDILSENSLRIATGLYLFSVEDLDSGRTQAGKFVIIQ